MILFVHIFCILWIGYYLVSKHPFKKALFLLLPIKLLAVPVYYLFYQKLYQDFYHFDAGKYFKDAIILKHFLIQHTDIFLRYLTGTSEYSDYPVILQYLKDTFNWDDGFRTRWIYNDNKLVILINIILSFVSHENYFVHACWFCFGSWLGLIYIQQFLHRLYPTSYLNHPFILYVASLFPFLWFYTGAVLKEPLLILLTALMKKGVLCMHQRNYIQRIKGGIFFLISLLLIRIPSMSILAGTWVITFICKRYIQNKYISALRILIIPVSLFVACTFMLVHPFKDFLTAKRTPYLDMQQGGIFLRSPFLEDEIRIAYLPEILDSIPGTDSVRVTRPVSYEFHTPNPALIHKKGIIDTSMSFKCIDVVRPARSTFYLPEAVDVSSSVKAIFSHLYHFLLPVHFSTLQEKIYAAENIFLLFSIFIILFYAKENRPLIYVWGFLFFILLSAYSYPNLGTLARYRSVWFPEILMGAAGIMFGWIKKKPDLF